MNPVDVITAYAAFPSVSTDPAYAEGMTGAREFIATQLETLGFHVEVVATPKHPILLAERGAEHEDWPHIVVYSHYDVQPADPFALWHSEPFTPTLRDGRLYARGAADNKGPTAIQVCALANVLRETPDLPLRITWLIEGEEEMGSPSFPAFLKQYAPRLAKADLIVMSDSGSQSERDIVITTALRGLFGIEVEVVGPKQDLHSGIHGGAVYNPIQALSEILASLHLPDGSVNVPGFYDAVVPPLDWERDELRRLSQTEQGYRDFLGVEAFHTAPGLTAFEAVRFAPTLEINGIGGGYQGAGTKTVIPSRAFAKITCRLVANQEPHAMMALVKAAILERAPKGVKVTVKEGDGGAPYLVVPPNRSAEHDARLTPLAKAFAAADNAIREAFGSAPLYLREGGSVPIIGQIKAATGLDTVMIGLFLPEDNLHAPNESMSLSMIAKGVACYECLFRGLTG